MAGPFELNTPRFLELKVEEDTQGGELGLTNKPGEIHRKQMQKVERNYPCQFETILLSACYFQYRESQYFAHIVFRSRFHYFGKARMKQAIISLQFSTPGSDSSLCPQVLDMKLHQTVDQRSALPVDDTDIVRVMTGDRTVFINTRSENRMHGVTIQGSSRSSGNGSIRNRAVWMIEEDRNLQVGIGHLFHGSVVVSCRSPFQMHLEVAVTQGMWEAIWDVVRNGIQEADEPVLFDQSKSLDPLNLESLFADQTVDLTNLATIDLEQFEDLPDVGMLDL